MHRTVVIVQSLLALPQALQRTMKYNGIPSLSDPCWLESPEEALGRSLILPGLLCGSMPGISNTRKDEFSSLLSVASTARVWAHELSRNVHCCGAGAATDLVVRPPRNLDERDNSDGNRVRIAVGFPVVSRYCASVKRLLATDSNNELLQ